jgi:Ca2+-binding EF-hand superfamily protein
MWVFLALLFWYLDEHSRRTDLVEVVRSMHPRTTKMEIYELKRLFDTFDLDASGSISLNELRTALKNLGEYTDELKLLRLLQEADSDGSGDIDFAEFSNIVLSLRTDAETSIFTQIIKKHKTMVQFCNFTRDKLLKMRKEFDRFDADKSGQIDVKELEAALRNLGEYKNQKQVDEIMAQADVDKSGSIEFVEFCLIIHAMAKNKKTDVGLGRAFAKQRKIFETIQFDEDTMTALQIEFNSFDTDFSGAIDLAEMEAALVSLDMWPGQV